MLQAGSVFIKRNMTSSISGVCIWVCHLLQRPGSIITSSKTSVKFNRAQPVMPDTFRQTQQRMSDFQHLEMLTDSIYIYEGGHDDQTYTRQQKE